MTTTPGTESQEWRSALTYQDIAEALQPHLPVPLPDREELGKALLTEIYDGSSAAIRRPPFT